MTLDAAFGFQSQSTKALASIDSTKYPDTNKDLQQNIIRLNQFVDYIASYLQTMQKGIDQNNQDPIAQIQGVASDLVVLLGGGELLYGIDLGDLQYFLPAIGALLGFDTTTPFPINLFNAAEHFLLGYVVPLDSFTTVIQGIIDGWLTALGIDPDFIQAVNDLLDAFGNLESSVEDFLTALEDLLNILGPMDGFGTLWQAVTTLLGGFSLDQLGGIIDPAFKALAPWIEELANAVNQLDDILKSFTGGIVDVQGILNFTSLFSSINFLPSGTFDISDTWNEIVNELLTPTDWFTELQNLVNLIESAVTNVAALFNISLPQLGAGTGDPTNMAIAFINDFLNPVELLTQSSDFNDLLNTIGTSLGGTAPIEIPDLADLLAGLSSAQPIIDAFVTTVLGLPGSNFDIPTFVRAIESIPFNFVTGSLSPSQVSHINIGALSSIIPEYLVNPNYDTPNALIGQSIWQWDGTQGPPGVSTSIYTDANNNGLAKEIYSNPVYVAPGQIFNIFGNARWQSFTGPANSIAITIAKFDNTNTLMGFDNLSPLGTIPAASGWVTISNTYTVPANVATIFVRPVVTAAATAGRVWFGKFSVKQTAISILAGLIPGLDASKIVSGQLAQTFVANLSTQLAGFATSSGILDQLIGMFPNTTTGLTGLAGLDAIFTDMLKVVGSPTALGSGTPVLPVPSSIPILGGLLAAGGGKSYISDLFTLNDHFTNAFIGTGSQFSGSTIPQARSSMDSIYNYLVGNTSSIQAIMNQLNTMQTPGAASFNEDFGSYNSGPLPNPPWVVTYSGPGSSTVGVKNGNAGWATLLNNGNRNANVVYTTPTNTDYQIVKGSMASPPAGASSGGQPLIYAICRVDNPNNPQNYVWARAYCTGFLTYKADIGCTIGGVETVWFSNIPLTWSTDITVVAGFSGNPRRYQAYSGTKQILDHVEPGTSSLFGSGYRYWGCRTCMTTGSIGASDPGSIASTSASDGS
jgi:hypothetical protein